MDYAEIEYWAEEFERLGLARYMTFACFMRAPRLHVERYDGVDGFRPLLPEQQGVRAELDLADECRQMAEHNEALQCAINDPNLLQACEELEERMAGFLDRIENGHPYERLKHLRYPR